MASNITKPVTAPANGIVLAGARFNPSASQTVLLEEAGIESITYSGIGDFVLKLREKHVDLLSIGVGVQETVTSSGIQCDIVHHDVSGSKDIRLNVWQTSRSNKVNLSSAQIHVTLLLKNSLA